MNILLGVTGSVAAIKLPEMVDSLSELGNVKVVATSSAIQIIGKIKDHYLPAHGLPSILRANDTEHTRICTLIQDKDEWQWDKIGDPVLHIDLKDWADVLVIAPLTANTLAKIAYGLADNLLTCICRAWPAPQLISSLNDPLGRFEGGKPIVVAPAMNTDMWEHPHTRRAFKTLWEIYGQDFTVVQPVEKKLACGTTGIGAMAPASVIAEYVRKAAG
jgi:phosphopantothenoylcysteine decarboxylase